MPEEADKYAQFSPKIKLLKHEEWKILRISVRERYFGCDSLTDNFLRICWKEKLQKKNSRILLKNYVDVTDFAFTEW